MELEEEEELESCKKELDDFLEAAEL